MHPGSLEALSDLNFIEANREHARWTSQGEIHETSEMVMVSGATRFPVGPFNSCTVLAGEPGAAAALERARAWFAERNRGFTIYVRTDAHRAWHEALARARLVPLSTIPAMLVE